MVALVSIMERVCGARRVNMKMIEERKGKARSPFTLVCIFSGQSILPSIDNDVRALYVFFCRVHLSQWNTTFACITPRICALSFSQGPDRGEIARQCLRGYHFTKFDTFVTSSLYIINSIFLSIHLSLHVLVLS